MAVISITYITAKTKNLTSHKRKTLKNHHYCYSFINVSYYYKLFICIVSYRCTND